MFPVVLTELGRGRTDRKVRVVREAVTLAVPGREPAFPGQGKAAQDKKQAGQLEQGGGCEIMGQQPVEAHSCHLRWASVGAS